MRILHYPQYDYSQLENKTKPSRYVVEIQMIIFFYLFTSCLPVQCLRYSEESFRRSSGKPIFFCHFLRPIHGMNEEGGWKHQE